jgi:hypothetical protein
VLPIGKISYTKEVARTFSLNKRQQHLNHILWGRDEKGAQIFSQHYN